MANFNSTPTGDNSANNSDYTPESFSDTDDTTQLPKLDERANGFNGNGTSDTLPTTNQEQNSPEDNNPEHKSHLGRNLVISGVAAVALAACIGIFNGSGDSSGSVPDTDNTPVAEETTDSNNIAIPAPTIETPSNEGKSWIDIISEEYLDEDGVLLTSQEVADYLGTSVSDLSDYAFDVATCLEDWTEFHRNNLYLTSCEVVNSNESSIPVLRASCDFENGFSGNLAITINPENGNFIIRISDIYGSQGYQFESNEIPGFDELAQIASQNFN